MAYLNVTPLILALRTHPEAFDFHREWLTHRPSAHSFKFLPKGKIDIRAHCNCPLLEIHPEQGRHLRDGFETWRNTYWRPQEINREFAGHFRPPSRLRRGLIAVTAKLNAWAWGRGSVERGVAAE